MSRHLEVFLLKGLSDRCFGFNFECQIMHSADSAVSRVGFLETTVPAVVHVQWQLVRAESTRSAGPMTYDVKGYTSDFPEFAWFHEISLLFERLEASSICGCC